MNLNQKVVVITGAKSGFGLSTAVRFAEEGAKVVVADTVDARQEVSGMVERGAEALFIQSEVRISPPMPPQRAAWCN